MSDFVPEAERSTAPLVATGIIGGWLLGRETGIRSIGGFHLCALGGLSLLSWLKKSGPIRALLLLGAYAGSVNGSRALSKKIGAWPAVLSCATFTTLAAHFLNDRR
ncbi:MAG: hypothetical protein Q3962_05050 [Corynebacterium sp.]|nr:hypothetical protein [Corynebacterium sp.]